MRGQAHTLRGAVLALSCVLAGPCMAQGIYRCGDSYSQKPCPGGKLVPTDDPRTAQMGAQTTQAAARDARMADSMEQKRLKEEAKAPPGFVYPDRKAAEPAQAKPTSAHGPKMPAEFKAVAPAKPGQDTTAKKKKTKKKTD
jgi:hypothetical protein